MTSEVQDNRSSHYMQRHSRIEPLTAILCILWALLPAAVAAMPDPPIAFTLSQAAQQTDGRESADKTLLRPELLTICLMGSWMHSYEEDTDELTIYRPEDYAFPISRGRTGFEFLAAGYLVYHGIGPADEPLVTPGHWELISRDEVAIEIDNLDGPTVRETLNIVSCSEDRLELAR